MSRSSLLFVGLGKLGLPVCNRLIKSNYFNRISLYSMRGVSFSRRHFNELQPTPNNVEIVENLRDVHNDVNYLITVLPNSNIVYDFINNHLPSYKCRIHHWIDMTSGDYQKTRNIPSILNNVGIFNDCAVSGGPHGASSGTLTAMIGGPKLSDESKNLLNILSSHIYHLGEDVGSGHLVKSVNNNLLAAHLISAAENLCLLKKVAPMINLREAVNCIANSSGGSKVISGRMIEHVINRNFNYGFDLEGLCKDVRNASQFTDDYSEDFPLVRLVEGVVNEANRRLGGSVDHTEIVKIIEEQVGQELK